MMKTTTAPGTFALRMWIGACTKCNGRWAGAVKPAASDAIEYVRADEVERAVAAAVAAEREACAAMKSALERIATIDWPRNHITIYRVDGVHSKHDKCEHGRRVYEDCDECAAAFARSALDDAIRARKVEQ